MNLNTQQLQYLIEIERTGSISQAAANLYMGQPNLSRVLRDTENTLGFTIFERTRKGVRPTDKGSVFLQHARNILRETDFMERLGPHSTLPNRFRICIPRSEHYMGLVQQFLSCQDPHCNLDAMIREYHPKEALDMLDCGAMEIAVIRYCEEFQDYFSELAAAMQLVLYPMSQTEYQIVIRADDPLAEEKTISKMDLVDRTDLVHRDNSFPLHLSLSCNRRISVVERAAQLHLLQTMPGTFLWSEPMQESILSSNSLVQRPCTEGGTLYQNALAYKPQCAMSDLEKDFLVWIREHT